MNSVMTAFTNQFSLMSQFEDVCHQLFADDNFDYLEKPVSYWARQGDRGLPYALLQRTVREVTETPFANLCSTPGIGPKKIASLLVLLHRALTDGLPKPRIVVAEQAPIASPVDFDADTVSESTWEEWRATVRRRGLENQMLGMLTPSLRDLPTVIWATTLGEYLDNTLDDLRELKTHGRKRIQTVLEVFFIVHSIFDEAGSHSKVCIVLRPSFVQPIEHWIQGKIASELIPDVHELRENLTLPLLNQIQIDGGDTVHQLASGRLGIETAPQSVRTLAERLDVTRGRIYQQLDTCAEVMRIRWPAGRRWFAELTELFEGLGANDPRRDLFDATRWLMFPERVEQRMVTNLIALPSIEDSVSRNREDCKNVVG
jgi:hypothetical protein